MKIIHTCPFVFCFLLAKALLFIACSTDAPPNSDGTEAELLQKEALYDSVKAAKYGADDYGMKKYVMAFLKRGPNTDLDSARSARLMRAHLDNINRMSADGTLVLAGPFLGNGDLRGIYIFDVDNIAAAEALTNTDPAIQAGSLEMELLEWYGSAALLDLQEVHQSLAKKKI